MRIKSQPQKHQEDFLETIDILSIDQSSNPESNNQNQNCQQEPLYEVESIIMKKINKEESQYLVKWKGYSELTWEPLSNLQDCQLLLDEFDQQQTSNNVMKCDIHCATKILTIVCGGLIIALAISRFTNLSIEHPQQFILTIHYLWMGAVLILAEFRFAYIHQKFKVLTSYFGRGLYCFFLGTLMISAFPPLQIATAVVLFVVGVIYILMQLFSKKFGWSAEEAKNPYQIPTQNQPNAYQPPYQSNVNFQQGGPALK